MSSKICRTVTWFNPVWTAKCCVFHSLFIRGNKWLNKLNRFAMVCGDTYLLWFVLFIMKCCVDLGNITFHYILIWSTFLSTHIHEIRALCCVNKTLVVCICTSCWCEWCTWHQTIQWDTVKHFHSPTAVPRLFIFQHSQFNKHQKAESNYHTKVAIHLKIEGF
jgi:hypothetical protein